MSETASPGQPENESLRGPVNNAAELHSALTFQLFRPDLTFEDNDLDTETGDEDNTQLTAIEGGDEFSTTREVAGFGDYTLSNYFDAVNRKFTSGEMTAEQVISSGESILTVQPSSGTQTPNYTIFRPSNLDTDASDLKSVSLRISLQLANVDLNEDGIVIIQQHEQEGGIIE